MSDDDKIVRLGVSGSSSEVDGAKLDDSDAFIFATDDDLVELIKEISDTIGVRNITGFCFAITHTDGSGGGEHDISFIQNASRDNILTLIGGLDIMKGNLVSNLNSRNAGG